MVRTVSRVMLPLLECKLDEGDNPAVLLCRRPTEADRIKWEALLGTDYEKLYTFIAEHCVGWRGINDEAGAPLPFSPGTRGLLFGQDKDAWKEWDAFVSRQYNRTREEIEAKKALLPLPAASSEAAASAAPTSQT